MMICCQQASVRVTSVRVASVRVASVRVASVRVNRAESLSRRVIGRSLHG